MSPSDSAAPIGVFDSGVGGLSVLREIRRELPHERLLYVADSAHAPYGDKPHSVVETRCLAIVDFLLTQGAKAIVVACNTATGAAIATLRARFSIPVVGMEPAVKPAAGRTRSGVIGVLATVGTASSDNVAGLLARFGGNTEILIQACPGLVELVEAGELDGAAVRLRVQDYLTPLLQRGVDTLVLGCTHYPFLRPAIQQLAGAAVTIIDPGPAVARELRRRLETAALLAPHGGGETFWSSATPARAQRVISQLWGTTVEVKHLP